MVDLKSGFDWTYKGMALFVKQDGIEGRIEVSAEKNGAGVKYQDRELWRELKKHTLIDEDKHQVKKWKGTGFDDEITTYDGGGIFSGGGNDTITGFAEDGAGQVHVYAGDGDDTIFMDFSSSDWTKHKSRVSSGHHVTGDKMNWKSKNVEKFGEDTFEFGNINNFGKEIVVGRIDDFDDGYDTIKVYGKKRDLNHLPSFMKLVWFNGDHNDPGKSGTEPQRWLLIKNNKGGAAFYAIDGARVDMKGDGKDEGGASGGKQEAHFISGSDLSKKAKAKNKELLKYLWDLPEAKYSNSFNYIPKDAPVVNGEEINDIDAEKSHVDKIIKGGDKDDLIAAGLNDDKVKAGSGNDHVWGGDGWDKLNGELGDDNLHGNRGNDKLLGGVGNDRLFGGDGNDRLFGGKGDDFLRDGKGHDKFYGGDGNDTISYEGWYSVTQNPGKTLIVNLNNGDNTSYDTIRGIENVIGSKLYGDRLYGDKKANVLSGLGGDDRLYGREGNDRLYGGVGNDTLDGGQGNDKLFGYDGDDSLYGYDGADTLYGGDGNDRLSGQKGDDTLYGVDGNDRLLGGEGNDTLHGGDGNDRLFGGDGNDRLYGREGNDRLYGQKGNDSLFGGDGDDVFVYNVDGGGTDRIFNLELGTGSTKHDVIRIYSDDYNSYNDVQNTMSQSGDHVLINFGGGNKIYLHNTDVSDLNADMFEFA